MLMRTFPFQMTFVAVASIVLAAGCGQGNQGQQSKSGPNGGTSTETTSSGEAHDPHDVPLTEEEIAKLKEDTAQYQAAIEHIQKYQQTIQQETTEGEPAKAHRALDNLDVVLERLPEAAQNSGLPKEKWQEVNETAQKLRDLFNQVHANIDAGENPDYPVVADQIDQGISALTAIEPATTE